jgi:hypothetical protein
MLTTPDTIPTTLLVGDHVTRGHAGLCQEIRSVNIMGEARDGRHFWAIGTNYGFQMQSITCAICGNYQSVSSPSLIHKISQAARCLNDDHYVYTTNVINEEEDSDEDIEGILEDIAAEIEQLQRNALVMEDEEELDEEELTRSEWEILSMRQ